MTIQVTKEPINLREKLNELETNKGLKGNEILQAETAQEVRSLIGAGRKNLIINGDFQVSQRGDYSVDGAQGFANGNYSVDRWKINSSAAGTDYVLHGTMVLPDGFVENSLKYTVQGTGVRYRRFSQPIEDVSKVSGRTVTTSFYIKAKSTTANNLYFYSIEDGAWQQKCLLPSTSTPTLVTHTFTVTDITDSFHCLIGFSSISGAATTGVVGDYFEISQVQLELGSVATDFEHRSYGEELALCQRYCYKLGSSQTFYRFPSGIGHPTIDQTISYIPFPVVMRGVPSLTTSYTTISLTINGTGNATSVVLNSDATSEHGANILFNFPAASIVNNAMVQYRISNQTDWFFIFDAEL